MVARFEHPAIQWKRGNVLRLSEIQSDMRQKVVQAQGSEDPGQADPRVPDDQAAGSEHGTRGAGSQRSREAPQAPAPQGQRYRAPCGSCARSFWLLLRPPLAAHLLVHPLLKINSQLSPLPAPSLPLVPLRSSNVVLSRFATTSAISIAAWRPLDPQQRNC